MAIYPTSRFENLDGTVRVQAAGCSRRDTAGLRWSGSVGRGRHACSSQQVRIGFHGGTGRNMLDMTRSLPVLAADLTFVKVNGGRGYGNMVNWDDETDPMVGQRVLAADGGSDRYEAIISDLRDGVIVLHFPQFATMMRLDGPT